MFLRLILISRLCWEILDENTVLKCECTNLNQLRKHIRKIYKGIKRRHYEIYFRYSLFKFMKVFDQYSYKIFFNMDSTKIIFMYLLDCDTYIPGTREFLKCLELRDHLEEEYEHRSKYEVEMKEPNIECTDMEGEIREEKPPTTTEIIKHATRHMEVEACFSTDMQFRYQMISALKKGFDLQKDAVINFPTSDIKFDKLQAQSGKKDKKKQERKSQYCEYLMDKRISIQFFHVEVVRKVEVSDYFSVSITIKSDVANKRKQKISQNQVQQADTACHRLVDDIYCTGGIFTLGGCGNKSPPFDTAWQQSAPTMKGDLLGDCPAKNQNDIYFLETNIKSESTNLANLFAPTNDTRTTEMFKYKPRPKLKQKLYPTLEFFVQNKSTNDSQTNVPACRGDSNGEKNPKVDEEAGPSASSPSESRRNSLDLYREAASILGLTCQQTDDCECLECQCHYFDFDEDADFSATGGEYLITSGVSGTSSTCSIQ